MASALIILLLIGALGSSWTTIATIGVALMGIGKAQGFAEGWVAGAIISGAYFGDKISPLSETTVLASSICGVATLTYLPFCFFNILSPLMSILVAATGYKIEVKNEE